MTTRDAEKASHSTDDAAMADHQHFSTRMCRCNVAERRNKSRRSIVIGLEADWTPVLGEIPRPAFFDLGMRQTLPRTNIGFTQPRVNLHWADAENLGDDLRRQRGSLEIAGPHCVEGTERETGVRGLTHTLVTEWGVCKALPPTERVPFALPMAGNEQPGQRR